MRNNDLSLVALLSIYGVKVLFTGDIEQTAEHDIVAGGELAAIDILKVAHHGSKTSSCSEILQLMHPKVAVISVGRDNSYGHPAPEVLDRFTAWHSCAENRSVRGDSCIVFCRVVLRSNGCFR